MSWLQEKIWFDSSCNEFSLYLGKGFAELHLAEDLLRHGQLIDLGDPTIPHK